MADFDEDDPLKDLLSDEEEFFKPSQAGYQPSKAKLAPAPPAPTVSLPNPPKKRDVLSDLGLDDDPPPLVTRGRAEKKSSIMSELFDSPAEKPLTTAAPKTNIRKLLGLEDEEIKPASKPAALPQSSSLRKSPFSSLEPQSVAISEQKSPVNNPSTFKGTETTVNIGGYAPSLGNQEPRRSRRPHSVERKFPLNDLLDIFQSETGQSSIFPSPSTTALPVTSQMPERSVFSTFSTPTVQNVPAMLPEPFARISDPPSAFIPNTRPAGVVQITPEVFPSKPSELSTLVTQQLAQITEEIRKLHGLLQGQLESKPTIDPENKDLVMLDKMSTMMEKMIGRFQSLCNGQEKLAEQLRDMPAKSEGLDAIKEQWNAEKQGLLTQLKKSDEDTTRKLEKQENDWRARESKWRQDVDQLHAKADEAQVKWKDERMSIERHWRELEAKWNVERTDLLSQLQMLTIHNEQKDTLIETLREKERNDPTELRWKERHAQLKSELKNVEELKRQLTLERENFEDRTNEIEKQKTNLTNLLQRTVKGKERLDSKICRYRSEASRLRKEDKKLQQRRKILAKAKAVLSEEILRLRLDSERNNPIVVAQSSPFVATNLNESLSYPALNLLKSLALQDERCLQDQNNYLRTLNLLL